MEKGKSYRFRVIGHGTIYPLRISVDNHNISVIASDGYDVTPTPCESFIINPGERFDFVVKADQDVSNYWVRALSMEVRMCLMYDIVIFYSSYKYNSKTCV